MEDIQIGRQSLCGSDFDLLSTEAVLDAIVYHIGETSCFGALADT